MDSEPLFVDTRSDSAPGTFVIVGLDEQRQADVLLDTLRDATRRFETALRRDHPAASAAMDGAGGAQRRPAPHERG